MISDNYESQMIQKHILQEFDEEFSKDNISKSRESTKNISFETYKIIRKWKDEEDENLINAISKFGTKNWEQISTYVKGRSPIQCIYRWTKTLQPGLIKGPWTTEEDTKVIEWVKRHGKARWTNCAEYIYGRSGKQCRERWYNKLNPNVKKGEWSPEEDYLLFQLYNQYGSQWCKIVTYLNGRTENSIK